MTRAGRVLTVLASVGIIAGCAASKPPPPAAPAAQAGAARAGAVSVESWTFGTTPGRVITTPSYRLFTTLRPGLITDRLPSFAEHAMARYRSAFGMLGAPPSPLDTYIMANRPQWLRVCAATLGAEAPAYQQITRGGVTVGGRAILYDIGTRDTFALLAHEGWHQYTQATLKEPLPIWLEEGIGAVMEGFRWNTQHPDVPEFLAWCNLERFDQLRSAADRDQLLPLEDVLGGSPVRALDGGSSSALVYYAQVWALTLFLMEGNDGRYEPCLRALLVDAQRGAVAARVREVCGERAASAYTVQRNGPEVFRAYFESDLGPARRAFDEFCRRAVAPGGRDAVSLGRSPLRPAPKAGT